MCVGQEFLNLGTNFGWVIQLRRYSETQLLFLQECYLQEVYLQDILQTDNVTNLGFKYVHLLVLTLSGTLYFFFFFNWVGGCVIVMVEG